MHFTTLCFKSSADAWTRVMIGWCPVVLPVAEAVITEQEAWFHNISLLFLCKPRCCLFNYGPTSFFMLWRLYKASLFIHLMALAEDPDKSWCQTNIRWQNIDYGVWKWSAAAMKMDNALSAALDWRRKHGLFCLSYFSLGYRDKRQKGSGEYWFSFIFPPFFLPLALSHMPSAAQHGTLADCCG